MFVDFNILNQLGSPSINSNTFANRPSAGQVGRLFVSTDTFEIYRDNGTGWDLIGGPGSSTVTGSGAAGQVTYWTGTNSVGGENNLWWDAANNRFGVNTNTPTAAAEVVQTDGVALYSNFTTNAGSGPGTTAILAKNTTNSSGYAAVIEENTPNVSAGQYPVLIRHTLSSGTAAANMATGIHFGLPDDAGTERINQFSMDTVDAAAATYSSRYRFLLRNNGSAVTPFYITGTGLGVFTATPGAALDIHSTGVIAQFNTTSGTGNVNIAFQRNGTAVWRIGDTYNGGLNFFELHNTVLGNNALQVSAATNKTTWQATENYTSGIARGNYFDYNLTINPANPLASPNAITALGASLDLTLQGSVTIPSGARSGLDAYNSIGFTTTGTLTQNQGSQLRTYSNLTTGWAFNGTQTGTITHLSGIHVRFPDNTGSAMAITNNYGVLINDQTANTGTVTYTNRWGIYQEGASDLNYMAANLLLGSTTNNGQKLQVTGTAYISSTLLVGITSVYGDEIARFYNSSNAGRYIYVENPNTGTSAASFVNVLAGAGADLRLGAYGTNHSTQANNATIFNHKTTGSLLFGTVGAERMRLDASGNLGLGVSPSAWTVFNPVLQVKTGSLASSGTANFRMFANTFYDGAYKYIGTGTATQYEQDGYHAWYTAPSGTAGNAISFTLAMTLNASGRLLVGTTTDNTFSRLQVSGSTWLGSTKGTYYTDSGSYFSIVGINQAINSYNSLELRASGVDGQLLLTTGGNVLIGTTTDNGKKLQVNGSGTYTGTGYDGTSAEIQLINNFPTTGRTFVINSFDSGGLQIADKTAGGASRFIINSNGNTELGGSIKTAAPTTGTAAEWKLGIRVAATVVLDTTQYIQLDVGGTLYKLAIVT